jgi:hypothetical protein
LSLDELVANSPSTGIAFKPENLVKAVLRSEVKAGRVLAAVPDPASRGWCS